MQNKLCAKREQSFSLLFQANKVSKNTNATLLRATVTRNEYLKLFCGELSRPPRTNKAF